MPSDTTTACVRLLVFFRIRHGTFPYSVEDDASTISQTPTTHNTNTCVKLTIVTHLSLSERIAIANLSSKSSVFLWVFRLTKHKIYALLKAGFVVFSRSLRDTFNLCAGPHWSN